MIGQSKNINKEYCKIILDNVLKHEEKFLERFGNRKVLHIHGTGIDNWFWANISDDIKKHLEDSTYPFDKKITSAWFSIIDGTEENPGFQGLHQDYDFNDITEDESEYLDTYITSVILYKSSDFSGGQFIIGGDGWTDSLTDPESMRTRAERKENLTHRLKVIENQCLGDTCTWTDFTVHGVAEVKSGRRITMMISKSYKNGK